MQLDRIAALATPLAPAALAVIRTSGAGTVDAVAALTPSPRRVREAAGGQVVVTRLIDPNTDAALDEVVLTVFRAPASYTGEDVVEISCHGNPAGVQRILAVLIRSGFRPAGPGEFTMRAFLAGKLDLTRAEAVNEIVAAQTARSHEMALARLAGSVETAINAIRSRLVEIMASVAVQLDYPEEETGEVAVPPEAIADARERLERLAATYRTGRLYQEGVRVAIVGAPNAGKSTLFNALLREERAIVSTTPGTTRDYIHARIDLDGIPVELYDTAGLRDAEEEIESEGIRRTRRVAQAADLVLMVVDASERQPAATDLSTGGRRLTVWNKIDLADARPAPAESYPISAFSGAGMDALLEGLLAAVGPDERTRTGDAVIDSLRQKQLLERASTALAEVERGIAAAMPVDALALDLQEALAAIGEITGEVTSEEILDAVFGEFCVGK